jgi:hypothetical protein
MKTLADFRIHPTAALFPLIEGEDFNELCESIRNHGLLEPVVIDGDELLDGRNRLRACEKAKIEPRFLEWKSMNLESEAYPKSSWIIDKNIERRHLSDDQRAAIWCKGNKIALREAVELEQRQSQFKPGDPRQNPGGRPVADHKCGPPQKRDIKAKHANSSAGKLAAAAKVPRRKAEQTIKIAKTAPELMDEIASGKLPLKEAVKITEAKAPPKPKKPRKIKAPEPSRPIESEPPRVQTATEILVMQNLAESECEQLEEHWETTSPAGRELFFGFLKSKHWDALMKLWPH